MLVPRLAVVIIAGMLGCSVAAPVAVNWPESAGITPDSISRIYRFYLGQKPVSVAGCGSRHIALRFANVPGDLLWSGAAPMTVDAGTVRARVGVATTLAMLAWNAVEESKSVDTVTIALRHPDGLSAQFTFVHFDTVSYLQPLRLVEGAVAACPLPT